MKKMNKIPIILIIIIFLQTTAIPKELDFFTYNKVVRIFRENKMDIDAKSYKGWIRVFNSKEKTKDYNFVINYDERKMILNFFRKKYQNKTIKYERGIE